MNAFAMVIEVVLLITAIFFAVCSIGANNARSGERCVVLSLIFVVALVALVVADLLQRAFA